MKAFAKRIGKLGYAVRAFFLYTTCWIDVPRVRVFVIFVHKIRGGGETGATWISTCIQDMLGHCQMFPPARYIDLADPEGPFETRVRLAEARFLLLSGSSCRPCTIPLKDLNKSPAHDPPPP